jgi:cysteinyl-tRNA synthetase
VEQRGIEAHDKAPASVDDRGVNEPRDATKGDAKTPGNQDPGEAALIRERDRARHEKRWVDADAIERDLEARRLSREAAVVDLADERRRRAR